MSAGLFAFGGRLEHLQIAVQKAGPVRTQELMGRSFRVFPAVLVREQVLQNNLGRTFLPAAEIAKSVDAWNAIPVVIRHPAKRGMPVSARSPEVLNARGAGFLFNAEATDNELRAEVWIDMTRAEAIPETGDVVNRVDSGEIGELSTGFATNVEKVAGTFDGQQYDAVLRDIRPDHLALLPDEVGACSVQDGCGLGVNCACGGKCQEGATNEDEEAEKPAGWIGKVVAALSRVFAGNLSDEDRRRRLSDSLREAFGGLGRDIWVDSVFSDEGTVVFEVMSQAGENGLFRVSYSEGEGGITFGDPEEVQRVTVFEPVANEAGAFTQEEKIMDRNQMIAHLAAQGTLTREDAEKLSDAGLKALCGRQPADNGRTDPEPQGDGWDVARRYRQELDELRQQTANAVQAENAERTRLLDDLLYVANTLPYNEQEIKAMSIVDLRKVHALRFPKRQDYTGRGGPRAHNAGPSFDFVRPILDGARGESILDRQEVN